MASIWVTGARGFIGRYLARQLWGTGKLVVGLGHGAWPKVEATQWGLAHWLNGEVTPSNLEQLRHDFGLPEAIFHLAGGSSVGAAIANPYEDFSRTVVSSAGLLEWLRQHSPATSLISVSTAAVYGAGHHGLIGENVPLSPFSPYGAHKLMMEELCRSYASNYGLKMVMPRLFSVYGPELKKQLLWDICGKISYEGEIELSGTGNELRDWIHVRDVAIILEKLIDLASPQAPAVNVASGIATSVGEIALLILEHWFSDAPCGVTVKFTGRSRPGDPFSLVADVSRLQSLRVGPLVPVSQGLAEYVAWYRIQTGRLS